MRSSDYPTEGGKRTRIGVLRAPDHLAGFISPQKASVAPERHLAYVNEVIGAEFWH